MYNQSRGTKIKGFITQHTGVKGLVCSSVIVIVCRIMDHRRLGFDCEILMIADYMLFRARNQKNHKVALSVYYYYMVWGQSLQLLDS